MGILVDITPHLVLNVFFFLKAFYILVCREWMDTFSQCVVGAGIESIITCPEDLFWGHQYPAKKSNTLHYGNLASHRSPSLLLKWDNSTLSIQMKKNLLTLGGGLIQFTTISVKWITTARQYTLACWIVAMGGKTETCDLFGKPPSK